MKHVFFVLVLSSLPFTDALAGSLVLKAQCSVSGDSVEVEDSTAKKDGWVVSEDELGDKIYSLDSIIDLIELPLEKPLGDLSVSVSRTGLMSIGMNVGDADAGADSSIQLPQTDGKLLPIGPLRWTVSGGDYASGMWRMNCKAEVTVTK